MLDSEPTPLRVPGGSPDAPPDDWVNARAAALLDVGQSVPEAEQRLVAYGLTPEAATAAVNSVLEQRARQRFLPLWRAERRTFVNRLLSAVIAGVWLLLLYWIGGAATLLRASLMLLLPLACIWFPEEMGSYAGILAGRSVTRPTPPGLVRFGGWMVLLVSIGVPCIVALYVAYGH